MATKPEFLVAKKKMLVALATVSVAISSPVHKFSKKSTLAFLINMVNHAVQREKRKYLITLGHTAL